MDPRNLAKIIQEFTGKELSEKDIYDYAHFLKGSEDIFDDEKREQIRSDLASIVMHSPSLAEKIVEEYVQNKKQNTVNLSYFVDIFAELAGKKLSVNDVIDYLSFLKNQENISDIEKRMQIESDLADIILKNSLLTRKVVEKHLKKMRKEEDVELYNFLTNPYSIKKEKRQGLAYKLLDTISSKPYIEEINRRRFIWSKDNQRKKLEKARKFFLEHVATGADHQIGHINTCNKNNKRLASVPDVYRYLESLETCLISGTHEQIMDARRRIKKLKNCMPLLTSTRLFYDTHSTAPKAVLVHNYGSPVEEQVKTSIVVDADGVGTNFYWETVNKIFEEDSPYSINNAFSLIYKNSFFKYNVFPKKAKFNKITCGTVYFDSSGIHLFKRGIIWKEKWGHGLYKDASTNRSKK